MRSFEDSGMKRFEQLLRDSAPEMPRRSPHKQQLRTVLLASLNRKRNGLRTLAVAASVAVCLVVLFVIPSRIVSSGEVLDETSALADLRAGNHGVDQLCDGRGLQHL